MESSDILRRLELLVGAKEPVDPSERESDYFEHLCERVGSLDSIAPEMLDQLLLSAGFNRPSIGFHEYFRSLGGSGSAFSFDEALRRWRVACMTQFGNFRYPYRQLSAESLSTLVQAFPRSGRELASRPGDVLSGLRRIARNDTPLLGYLAGKTVQEFAKRQEEGEDLSKFEQELLTRFKAAADDGLHNTYEYCSMPFMDVYVATSMRDHEDFFTVSRFTDGVFGDGRMSSVAFFDPTQSSHPDRIVKGIVEGLMLKRAAVTVYLAQEGDTLGKDSELAATLAQGKVVIAFVPEVTDLDATADHVIEDSRMATQSTLEGPTEDEVMKRLLDRAKAIDIELWLELENMRASGKLANARPIARAIAERLRLVYERRADTLLNQHPLGLQVDVRSGVANGIIVCRTADQCRDLVLEALENRLEFDIEARSPADLTDKRPDLAAPPDWDRLMIERRTGSVHRVVIGDALILNSFWNWYTASGAVADSVRPSSYRNGEAAGGTE